MTESAVVLTIRVPSRFAQVISVCACVKLELHCGVHGMSLLLCASSETYMPFDFWYEKIMYKCALWDYIGRDLGMTY